MLKKIGVLFFSLFMALVPVEAAKGLEEVVLRDGEPVPEVLVRAVLINLKFLIDRDKEAFMYLFEKVVNPDYEFPSDIAEKLEGFAFLKNGVVHESVRAIMLSLMEKEDLDMGDGLSGEKPVGKSRKAQAVDLEEDL